MRFEPLGDTAFILRDLQGPAYAIADELNSLNVPGLVEATASYETVGLYVEPRLFNMAELAATIDKLHVTSPSVVRHHQVPVCFEMGADLSDAANELQLSLEELVSSFCARDLCCYAVGFCPGFPYLG